ncbi:tyrosine-protein phosphatase 99A isoform X3 [Venturia canescens]|uniref:tyrosine-protein phosphatase 99A isoform X3 n=1 Tax=Venturia canescens TaxID=32260 RepID=UPI001C9D1AC9|nr:tyrosine-protein phosphatase 99A isoform X3 [Venturia canescens]
MDVRKPVWIISCAYIFWFFVGAVTAGRVFDVMNPVVTQILADAGQNLTLECPGVTEYLMVSRLEWRSNDVRIVEYGSQSTTLFVHSNRVSLLEKKFALFFSPVKSEDSGEYQCLVNSRNVPEVIVNLTVQDVPDPPGRPIATNFTSRSITISWAPSENSHNNPISHYIINVRVGENGPWDEKKEIVTPNNDTKYYLDNLMPFTSYSFRVSAVNARGRSAPSITSHYITTLREVPVGKPTITAAYNTSATSILIAWKPPSLDTMNGEFLGYRIAYKPRNMGPEHIKEIYIRNRKTERHTITNLETFTQYSVSLAVFNPEGTGPNASVVIMTDEGVPSKPLNLTAHGVNSTSIELSWSEPDNANGAIEGYRVYFMHSNFTDVRTQKKNEPNHPVIEFVLNKLNPFTEYKIWVKAYTWKNEGEPSEHIIQKTDISGPSAPVILNLTCQAHDAIYLYWARPEKFWNSIDYYYIMYRSDNNKDYEEMKIPADTEHLNSGITIPNLTMNTVYEVMVAGATRSHIKRNLIIRGNYSMPGTQLVAPNCDKTPPLMRRSNDELSAGVIAGMICACFAVMLAVTALVLWRPPLRRVFRKCFQTTYCFLDYPPRNVPTLQEWENSKQDGERTAVAVQRFVQHVAALHADGDIGFSKEFELFPKETELYLADNSKHAENQSKNRYGNIIAYDHSRVRLLSCVGGSPNKGQDYINANYIDGWQRSRAYIGTQGPLPSTIDSFWQMVWEQRVSIIVMITNLVERGRPKCDMYWPKEGTESYGHIQVSLLREDVMATYTIRTLHIRHLKQIKKKKNGVNVGERTVYQYHYTGWPDHGVPDHPLPVLSFIRKSSNANPPAAGPIIVHCSAGVGRTGAYIVIDAMLKQAKSKNEINVFGFLKHIRTQRYSLVQTEEQYIFIHDALQEAIESGETNIPVENLLHHVQEMLVSSNTKTDPWNSLEAQYKLVTAWKPKDFNLVSATKACNVNKNRNPEIVPIETARVHLTPKAGIDGSDYINATWFPGFQRNREFIVTQHPLKNTIKEFWQMMWDHNSKTVVMLTQCDEEYPEFWPSEGEELNTDNFRVHLCGVKKTVSGVVLREIVVRSLQDDYELSARIVQGPVTQSGLWPHNNNPKAFVDIIQDFHRDYQNGPIVVMDRYGGIEAGLFILMTTLMKQLEFEKSADIYMFAKLLYMKRPGIIRSKEDYVLIYQCLEAVLSSKSRVEPDLYIMANGHVNCSINDTNEAVQRGGMDYSTKIGTIRDYASLTAGSDQEYVHPDYAMSNRMNNINAERGCTTIDGCADYDDDIMNDGATIPLRNPNYSNHTGEQITIDANGYITNGSMRIPPEGMEATCGMVPQ